MNNSQSSQQSSSLQFVYQDFETLRTHFLNRKREIEDLISLFVERAEAERAYSQRLSKIALSSKKSSISSGKLAEEVAAYKQDCMSKARQAEELAENIQSDCVTMMRELLDKQEEEFFSQKMEGRIIISNLHDIDQQVKTKAIAYYRAAKEAEECVARYEEIKYSVEISYGQKKIMYDSMIGSLKKIKEREVDYKEVVDNANNFMIDFRQKLNSLILQLREFEIQRSECVHSAINKFVVYEKCMEMNNKYDVGNFSKILDEYNNDQEVANMEESLFPNKLDLNTVHKFNFIQYESKKYNLQQIQHDQLTPPREKLSHYTNINDLLKFIFNKIFQEQPIHEEYLMSLSKIFQTQEGKQAFIETLERRFKPDIKILLGKYSFQNIKDSLDLLLHEEVQEPNIHTVLTIKKYMNTFNLKGSDEMAIKGRVRDHIIWKSDKVWKLIYEHRIKPKNKAIKKDETSKSKPLQQEEEKQGSENVIDTQQNESTQDFSQTLQNDCEESDSSQLSPSKEESGIQSLQSILGSDDQQRPKSQQLESKLHEFNRKEQLFSELQTILKEMVEFRVPYEVLGEFHQYIINEYQLDQYKDIHADMIDSYKQKQTMERQIEADRIKKKPQAQKGVPDWLQELYDPIDSLQKSLAQTPGNQSQGRDSMQSSSGAKSLAMTFRDLIKPRSNLQQVQKVTINTEEENNE